MTYLNFLLYFIVPPILILLLILRRSSSRSWNHLAPALFFLVFMAISYTTPWDNYLVKKGVWWYGADRVLGVIGYVPIEEYMFFVLQTLLTGLGLFLVRRPYQGSQPPSQKNLKWVVGCLGYLTLSLVGFACLFQDRTLYLGLILAWAGPIMLLQWFLGGDRLLNCGTTPLKVILVFTVYLGLADALAISLNIWSISPQFTTGLFIGNLPLEEGLFFLATNVMVVQGLELALSYKEGWTLKSPATAPLVGDYSS